MRYVTAASMETNWWPEENRSVRPGSEFLRHRVLSTATEIWPAGAAQYSVAADNMQVRTNHAVYVVTLRFTPSRSLRGITVVARRFVHKSVHKRRTSALTIRIFRGGRSDGRMPGTVEPTCVSRAVRSCEPQRIESSSVDRRATQTNSVRCTGCSTTSIPMRPSRIGLAVDRYWTTPPCWRGRSPRAVGCRSVGLCTAAARGFTVLHDDAVYDLAQRHLPDGRVRRVVSLGPLTVQPMDNVANPTRPPDSRPTTRLCPGHRRWQTCSHRVPPRNLIGGAR
jgi:hypothetical protein